MQHDQKPDYVARALVGAALVIAVILFHFSLVPLSDWLGWTYATTRGAILVPIALLIIVILRKSSSKKRSSDDRH